MKKKEYNKLKMNLCNLICEEQIQMILRNHTLYDSDEYKKLEKLKMYIKDL